MTQSNGIPADYDTEIGAVLGRGALSRRILGAEVPIESRLIFAPIPRCIIDCLAAKEVTPQEGSSLPRECSGIDPDVSLDLHLDNFFIVFERPTRSCIDFFQHDSGEAQVLELQRSVYVHDYDAFWVHPGEFILGGSREYVALPYDMVAYITGRSSWGRTGIIVETAGLVHPCFKGTLVLEITNIGRLPIALKPGIRIAQMSFHKVTRLLPCDCKDIKARRYDMQIRPCFSKAYDDDEVRERRSPPTAK